MSSLPPRPPAAARSSGEVRLARPSDVPALARLYMSIFRGRDGGSCERAERHFKALFFDHPLHSEVSASLVYELADGEIVGLFGSLPAPMRFEGRPITGSIISTWMVRPGPFRASAATSLVRAHLKRRHDISLTNTANATSMAVQESLHFRFASHYSLEWFKILNLSAYAAAILAKRAGGRLPGWVAPGVDAPERVLRHASGLARRQAQGGWRVEEIGPERFAAHLIDLNQRFRLQPDWSERDVAWMLGVAAERVGGGPLRLCAAFDEKGALGGVFAYFAPPMGRAEAIHVVARRHGEGPLLRALIADADQRRCAYVCGAAGPLVVRGFFDTPRIFYRQAPGVAFRAGDIAIADAVAYGEGPIGGLLGDGWTPLATESYAS